MRSTSLFLRSPEPLHRAWNPIGKGTWRGWGIEGMLDSRDKKDCINDPMYVSCHLNISVLYWNMLFSRNEDYTVLIEWHVLRRVFLTDLQCINIATAAPPFENQKNNRIIQRNCLHTHTNHTFPAAQDSLSLTLTFCVMNYAALVPYVYAAPLEWSEPLGLEPTEMGFLNQLPWNLEMPLFKLLGDSGATGEFELTPEMNWCTTLPAFTISVFACLHCQKGKGAWLRKSK